MKTKRKVFDKMSKYLFNNGKSLRLVLILFCSYWTIFNRGWMYKMSTNVSCGYLVNGMNYKGRLSRIISKLFSINSKLNNVSNYF